MVKQKIKRHRRHDLTQACSSGGSTFLYLWRKYGVLRGVGLPRKEQVASSILAGGSFFATLTMTERSGSNASLEGKYLVALLAKETCEVGEWNYG